MPFTTPDEEIAATKVLLLLHTPPPVPLLNADVVPTHMPVAPTIADGNGWTVTVALVWHPVGSVYFTVAVPAVTPSAIPLPDPIIATDVLPLLQVPPLRASLNVVANPVHAFLFPAIGAGPLTVTVIFAAQLPPN